MNTFEIPYDFSGVGRYIRTAAVVLAYTVEIDNLLFLDCTSCGSIRIAAY